jgi:UDPglucose 6-dehydrogenase
MSLEKIESITRMKYSGPVYNLEVEPNDSREDDQYYVNADNGMVVHNCHPRDNIALRWMAENLDLGYDLFDAVMRSREVQAENMAKRLVQLADNRMPVVIIGKAYKPLVPYTAGSSSMLVGHYVQEMDIPLYYHDYTTGDLVPEEVLENPAVYLIAHDPDVTYGDQLDHVREFMKDRHVSEADQAFTAVGGLDRIPAPGSVILDPWRKVHVAPELGIRVVHYGNTRTK